MTAPPRGAGELSDGADCCTSVGCGQGGRGPCRPCNCSGAPAARDRAGPKSADLTATSEGIIHSTGVLKASPPRRRVPQKQCQRALRPDGQRDTNGLRALAPFRAPRLPSDPKSTAGWRNQSPPANALDECGSKFEPTLK